MPSTLTYPGVYVEEIPSGVRTITGVPTSVTAFVGRARKGPTHRAIDITSWEDFERRFGGLWLESNLGYAVRDFYLNGGGRAVIVRLFHGGNADDRQGARDAIQQILVAVKAKSTGKDAKAASLAEQATIKASAPAKPPYITGIVDRVIQVLGSLGDGDDAAKVQGAVKLVEDTVIVPGDRRTMEVGTLRFQAASEGSWGGGLRIEASAPAGEAAEAAASAMGVQVKDLFNLAVTDIAPGGTSERFLNLTVRSSSRRVDKILAEQSNLIAWSGPKLDEGAPVLPDFGQVRGDSVGQAYAALLRIREEKPDPTEWVAAQTEYGNEVKKAMASVDDGTALTTADFLPAVDRPGLHALEQLYSDGRIFNLLCIPPYDDNGISESIMSLAESYCTKRRAVFLVDPPKTWTSVERAQTRFGANEDKLPRSKNAAVFFPKIKQPNPLRGDQLEEFSPCGVIAGIIARTDVERGVWKSPAGIDASLKGVSSLAVPMTDEQNGLLNPLGINCLRSFPIFGNIVWGARTLRGADDYADEYKYLAVRRTALFIEESLYRGLKWVVFEPNDEPLWGQIRLNVGAFMNGLFRQGAFQGASPREAYFVKCDAATNPQSDINLGIVNIMVGFRPLKPVEFVVLKIQQMAGQIES